MSSKDPDEVDQTWQVQEIAQCGEKDVAAAAKKARGTQKKIAHRDVTRIWSAQALQTRSGSEGARVTHT